MNIVGSEWIIIIFVALVLILGTKHLPSAAKKMGKAVNEYNKAKNDVQNQMKDFSNHTMDITTPVQNERQKLEIIAKSLGVSFADKSDEELRDIISSKIGKPQKDESSENKTN